jgi:hypothetical protein
MLHKLRKVEVAGEALYEQLEKFARDRFNIKLVN